MQGKLHLYTGDGKGKTTAAMGLALRALGHGLRVVVTQFMKDGSSGELTALQRLGAQLVPGPVMTGFTFQMTEAELAAQRASMTAHALQLAEDLPSMAPDVIVLDEFAIAAELGLLESGAARTLLAAALQQGETVVTGASAPAWLLDQADYVSRISALRHPFATEGLPARRGIEW